MSLRMLTVKQPWAWAIIHGGKDVENRSWSTKYRGPVAVHAGLAWTWDAAETVERLAGVTITPWECGEPWETRGAVIGLVDLIDIASESDSPWADDSEFHWLLANPRPLPEPSRVRGSLGLRQVPGPLAELYLSEVTA